MPFLQVNLFLLFDVRLRLYCFVRLRSYKKTG
nr:MAG TPA: hypothetical protein [Caudoviricetes sp.]